MLRKVIAYPCAAIGVVLLLPVAIIVGAVGLAVAILCAVPAVIGLLLLTVAYALTADEMAELTADAMVPPADNPAPEEPRIMGSRKFQFSEQ